MLFDAIRPQVRALLLGTALISAAPFVTAQAPLDPASGAVRTRDDSHDPRARSRGGDDGRVLSTDEGVFLVALPDGTWTVQARSMMGT